MGRVLSADPREPDAQNGEVAGADFKIQRNGRKGCGWGAKQIADELSVSQNTVWSHVKHIYAKLGVQSKQEAINLWEGFGA